MDGYKHAHSRWSLYQIAFPLRIFLFLLFSFLLAIVALSQYSSTKIADYLLHQAHKMAVNQSRLLASNDNIIAAVKRRDPVGLGKIVAEISGDSHESYVEISDSQSVRLYHPDPEKRGYSPQGNPFVTFGSDGRYFNDRGEGDIAIQARTPIFDSSGRVIGSISLIYPQSKTAGWRSDFIRPLAGTFAPIFIVVLLLSWLFTAYIRRQMLGMEPRQLARIVSQQEALFESVVDGLIVIDRDGFITGLNGSARRMLGLSPSETQWLGCAVDKLVPPATFQNDDAAAAPHGVSCTLNGLNVIASRHVIRYRNEAMGAILCFRPEDEITALNAQLSQLNQQKETLRTLRHEHLNLISTIGGLLQMKEYDRALAMVKSESQVEQTLVDSLREGFADRQVAGLIYGKAQRALELGITLTLVEGSQLEQLPVGLNSVEFAAVVGNLLDNAFDATLRKGCPGGRVELYLSDEGTETIIEVADWGTGIPQNMRKTIFHRGISSKTDDPGEHGIGLYLVARYVARCGGVITLEDNHPSGTLFSIFIPKVKPKDGL